MKGLNNSLAQVCFLDIYFDSIIDLLRAPRTRDFDCGTHRIGAGGHKKNGPRKLALFNYKE